MPTANGQILLDLARIKPEYVSHYELGAKTNPTRNSMLNIVFHNTQIKDYQTQVQTAEVGVNRGYLANADKVRVWGIELDGTVQLNKLISFYGNIAYTDAQYTSFLNAPTPLEETGAPQSYKNISKGDLPGVSKWAGSLGGEVTSAAKTILQSKAKLFAAIDMYFRSSFSSSPSPSKYLNIDGYALLNARAGLRASEGLSLFLWVRNALNKDYFEQLLPASGNAGHYAGVVGDPRTFGITLRYVIQ